MKIWIHLNGVQEGPFDEGSLPLDRMTPSTPVWYEGLPYWMPATKAPVTAEILARHYSQDPQAQPIPTPSTDIRPADGLANQVLGEPQGIKYPQMQETPRGQQQMQQTPKCPPTYIIWSVLLTVLCCNVIGIIPIITGVSVTSKYNNYNFEGARRSSQTTEWWLMITIVTSLMMLPLSIIAAL